MKNWNKPLDEHEFDDDFLKELFARESPAEEKSKEKMEEIYDEIHPKKKWKKYMMKFEKTESQCVYPQADIV